MSAKSVPGVPTYPRFGPWPHMGWMLIVWGILALAAGIAALVWPGLTVLTLALIFGAFAIITGIVEIVHAIGAALTAEGKWLLGLRGLIAVILGALAFFLPGLTVSALVLLLGAYLFVVGVLEIFGAFRRHFHGWLVVRGIIAIVLGIVAVVWPGIAVLALGVVFGVYAILGGITALSIGWRLTHARQSAS